MTKKWWAWPVLVGALTLLWTGIHLIYGDLFFDADQGIIGLMAKDLATGRSLPWTFYGQKYLFALESWFAALSFLFNGVSIFSLKLPLAFVHATTAILTFRIFQRECQLSPLASLVATSPLIMPSFVAGSYLMAAHGGAAWPALYIVMIWLLRHTTVSLGFLIGMGYFHREFIIFGVLSLLICDLLQTFSSVAKPLADRVFRRNLVRTRVISLVVALTTYHSLVGLGQWNENFFGPGRPKAKWHGMSAAIENFTYLCTHQLPALLGFDHRPLISFDIRSSLLSGIPIWGSVNALLLMITIVFSLFHVFRKGRVGILKLAGFPLYCLLATLGQWVVYILFVHEHYTVLVRYLLLVPLGVSAIIASGLLLFQSEKRRFTALPLACATSLFLANLVSHTSVLADRIQNPWQDPSRALAERLMQMGYSYGWAPYWGAYYLSFITNESLLVASMDHTRVKRTRDVVKLHLDESFVLSASPELCAPEKTSQIDQWFICPFHSYHGEIAALTQDK